MNIKITLYGKMLSSQCIYGRNAMNFFVTHKARKIKKDYIEQVKNQYCGPLVTDKLFADIKLYFNDRCRRDWDNFHKLTIDSLQGIVIRDDSQIHKAVVEKFYDKGNPRCEINLFPYNSETFNNVDIGVDINNQTIDTSVTPPRRRGRPKS